MITALTDVASAMVAQVAVVMAATVVGFIPTDALARTTEGQLAPDFDVRVMSEERAAESGAPRTPLGSLWKLFVYAYQSEKGLSESPYVCRGDDPEEFFCCQRGETIDRDQALARSCSPYFRPARLSITDDEWKAFWKSRLPQTPTWLADLKQLTPERRVNVDELLSALIGVRRQFKTFDRIEAATLGTVLHGTAAGALKVFGSTLRVKTFTWRDEETRVSANSSVNVDGHGITKGAAKSDVQGFTGGFAGWLPDGSAIWVSGPGHGRDTFHERLMKVITPHLMSREKSCVKVRYFDRYPIESVQPATERLQGAVRIRFKNGRDLAFQGDGSLRVHRAQVSSSPQQPLITAELSVNEYVARVIDREIEKQPLEAARAFAVAIRTFLYQNARRSGACWEIADSSRYQRVSPKTESAAALRIAEWSDGLVLDRVGRVHYHSTTAGVNRMAWSQAKSLALSGFSMEEILKNAYPTGVVAFGEGAKPIECKPNPLVAKWIKEQSRGWRRSLNQVPGFEQPTELKVCLSTELTAGWGGKKGLRAFSHPEAQQVFVPKLHSREDEISVLHEYLHVAFRNHPRGREEAFIEQTAHQLLEEK